ncbi:hypothetical protein RHSIM_Rhsim05G0143600 [Rhododendron simsii]|uniref:Signal peptidase complex subunit 3 n=1 Tax=Rhododendron simsii TaxID=118357 RepID=A0A834LLP8_RHOSS|nr:hypothetical protein RHSIM_Rhsim05G0143600 [Rhododendron simsii]
MHSFGFRANALLTFSVSNINRFQKSKGNDEIVLTDFCPQTVIYAEKKRLGVADFSLGFRWVEEIRVKIEARIRVVILGFRDEMMMAVVVMEHISLYVIIFFVLCCWFDFKCYHFLQVSMTLNVSANLQSLFTWNTKQVFVFLAAEYESPKNSLNQVSFCLSSIWQHAMLRPGPGSLFRTDLQDWSSRMVDPIVVKALKVRLGVGLEALDPRPNKAQVVHLTGGRARHLKETQHRRFSCDCASGVLSRAQVALDCIHAFVFFSVVSLWDAIIPSKEQAQFLIQTKNKYRFTDQGTNLRGKEYNLTLHWHVMPKTGKMFADKIVMTGFRLPEEYR